MWTIISIIGGLFLILSVVFLIAMLVGLVFPKLLNRSKPSRIRIVKTQGLYALITFIIGFAIVGNASDKRPVETIEKSENTPEGSR